MIQLAYMHSLLSALVTSLCCTHYLPVLHGRFFLNSLIILELDYQLCTHKYDFNDAHFPRDLLLTIKTHLTLRESDRLSKQWTCVCDYVSCPGPSRKGKQQSKAVPLRHARAKEKGRYSSYSFLSSALDGSGQLHAPAALYPRGKDPRYPFDRRLGVPKSWSGQRG
jgi:hypothetical protein